MELNDKHARTAKFLVKNWEFSEEGSSEVDSYTHANWVGRIPSSTDDNEYIIRKPYGEYHWLGIPEVSDMAGIPGQNNSNPYSDFGYHLIISVNGIIYDPSYGKKYKSLVEWEEHSIEAILLKSKERMYETKLGMDLNGDGAIKDVDWTRLNFKKNSIEIDFTD